MTSRIPVKVLIHVWSYDFYDMTLSTGKQRRHMIKGHKRRLWGSIFGLKTYKKYRGIDSVCLFDLSLTSGSVNSYMHDQVGTLPPFYGTSTQHFDAITPEMCYKI